MEDIKKPKVGGAKRLSEFSRDIRKSEPSKKLKDLLSKKDKSPNDGKKVAKPRQGKIEADL